MAFQSVPNCAEAHVSFACNGVSMENSLKFHRTAGTYDQGDLDALADAVDAWVDSVYLPLVSGDVLYVQTEVVGLTNIIDLQSINNDNTGAGGVAEQVLPFNVSLAIKFSTGFTGRSARGRAYMIGSVLGQLTTADNFFRATHITAVIAMWDALASFVFPVDWEHVVVSRFSDGVKREEGTFLPVTTYSAVDARVDSQRGRLP